ncbi:unnamed protein product, partial [Amoebophrya sp. A25]
EYLLYLANIGCLTAGAAGCCFHYSATSRLTGLSKQHLSWWNEVSLHNYYGERRGSFRFGVRGRKRPGPHTLYII